MTEIEFRVAILAGFGAVIATGAALSRRYGRPGSPVPRSADGRLMATTLAVGGMVLWGGLLAYVAWPPALAWSSMGLSTAARWTGLPLFLAGAGVAMWARFTLGRASTVTSVPAPDSELVTHGPYRVLRHPIYTGGMLMVAGAAALSDSGFILFVGLALLAVLDVRTRREERLLLDRYGDAYARHMARTHRWLPRLGA